MTDTTRLPGAGELAIIAHRMCDGTCAMVHL
jgi:hypothetical protein